MSTKTLEVTFVTKPAFRVAGLKVRAKAGSDAFMKVWTEFDKRMGEVPAWAQTKEFYSAMDNYDEATGEFDYLACGPVTDADNVPPDMEVWDISEQTYAVFEATLPTLGEIYSQIYGMWLPSSGYDHAPAAELEIYGEGFDPKDPNSILHIYVPVVKKG